MKTDPIVLSFRYEEIDYVRALRAHYATVLRLRLDLIVCAFSVAAGAYLCTRPDHRILGILLLGLVALFVSMLVVAFLVIPRRVFRQEPKFRDDYSLTFTPEGIEFRTAHINSRVEWGFYTHGLIDDYSYILYYGKRQFSVVPKRVFVSAEQRAAFDRLVAERIPVIKRVGA